MIVPTDALSEDALENLIKEYCLQQDWSLNESDAPLGDRVDQVRSALLAGKLLVLYSEIDETARLISADEAKGMQ